MKLNHRSGIVRAGLASAALLASLLPSITLSAGVASASPSAPPWEPDANASAPYANIVFFDSNGNQVTSGTNLMNPFAYAVATTPADPGSPKANMNFYNPRNGVNPGNWTGTAESGNTTFNPASGLPAGTPADVRAFAPTYPVVAATANIITWLNSNVPDTTPGYANTIQVRLQDTLIQGTTTYWDTDIGYNTTSSPITVDGTTVPANGWAQLFPFVTTTTTTLTTVPSSSPQPSGTPIQLNATVQGAGTVQFYDGTTALGTPVTVSSNKASYTDHPVVGSHSYSAVFVPLVGDETGYNTANAAILAQSTSNTVPMQINAAGVTVTGVSPAKLSQGASNVSFTLTGTGFVSGATVTASGSGITFSSVVVVSSTSITAKGKATSTAALGTRNVTVTDSSGSGTCTGCLTVVAKPTLTAISPNSVARGAVVPATLTGTGFVKGAKVTGPSGVTFSSVKVVSSTKITATMTVSSTAPTGSNLPVTVTNNATAGGGKAVGNLLTIT